MSLGSFATSFLLSLTSLLGVETIPSLQVIDDMQWHLDQTWTNHNGRYEAVASSDGVIAACQKNPGDHLTFPTVVHGAHELFLNNVKIMSFGDPNFQENRSFYGSPSISCRDVLQAAQIISGTKDLTNEIFTWKVYCYTSYFARFTHFPRFVNGVPTHNVFQESLNIIAGGALLVLILITGVLFWKKVPTSLVVSLILASGIMSLYFIASTASFFGISGDMLTLHKIADFSLWFGGFFLFNAFRMQGFFGLPSLIFYGVLAAAACLIIANGTSGDVIQLGTMIPFPAFFSIQIISLARLGKKLTKAVNRRRHILEFLSMFSFTLAVLNDLFVVSGLIDGGVILSVGIVCGIMFLALDVNERIAETYKERDYLRKNLEFEVDQKTQKLQQQTTALEQALASLKTTQAELIQSAKMASLGTLSAGIAHEINNSLNYVNGAMSPLINLIGKAPAFDGKEKALKLTGIMQNGLALTFSIIKSLRNYTGLNQAKLKDHSATELITTVLTILKSKVPENVKITTQIEDGLSFHINAAAMNQVLMNLLVNAIDAMPKGGEIFLSAKSFGKNSDAVEISVKDTGSGIPEQVQKRVFEPFFTTKDVGSGTGLGLHIVKTEVERHGGTLRLNSTIGQGTTFTLVIPATKPEFAAAKAKERVA